MTTTVSLVWPSKAKIVCAQKKDAFTTKSHSSYCALQDPAPQELQEHIKKNYTS